VTTKAPCSASPAAWIKGGGGIEGAPKAGGTGTAATSEAVGHGKSTRVTSPNVSVAASMRAAAPVVATRIDFHGVSVCVARVGSVGEETVSTSAESRAVAKTEGQNSLLRWLIFI
jgi:hypothetical protein